MRAINHALTGALVGLVVQQPVLAGASAVISHYVCDAIPHYGANLPGNREIKSVAFKNSLYIDALACALLILVLALTHPRYWHVAAVCAFLAAAPDFLSFNRFITIRKGNSWRPGMYTKFAAYIQWFERPIGAVVEVAWFVGVVSLLIPFVR